MLAVRRADGVVAVEVTRHAHESISQAVGVASDLFVSALAGDGVLGRENLWLVVSGAPVSRTDRVAAYIADRDGVWGVLERQGFSIPSGSRRDGKVPVAGDSFVVVGSVALELADVPAALELSRLANAVCVATAEGDPPPVLMSEPPAFTAIRHQAAGSFAARAFGHFDDRVVGVEVFALDTVLDALERTLSAEVG